MWSKFQICLYNFLIYVVLRMDIVLYITYNTFGFWCQFMVFFQPIIEKQLDLLLNLAFVACWSNYLRIFPQINNFGEEYLKLHLLYIHM